MQNQPYVSLNFEYRHYNLPINLPALAFLGNNWRSQDTKLCNLHFHNCMEIGYCHEGSGFLIAEGKQLPFRPGDICVIPENTMHGTQSSPGEKSRWEYIMFDPKLLFPDGVFHDFSNEDCFLYDDPGFSNILRSEDFPILSSVVKSLFREFHSQQTGYRESLRGLFLSFMANYADLRSSSDKPVSSGPLSGPYAMISPALLYIRESYSAAITVPYLASLCSLSETHFRRIFESIMGMPPLSYLHYYRIRKACHLLIHSNLNINEIAAATGFVTLSSFNRKFRSITNVSPRQWKKDNMDAREINYVTSLDAGEDFGLFLRN